MQPAWECGALTKPGWPRRSSPLGLCYSESLFLVYHDHLAVDHRDLLSTRRFRWVAGRWQMRLGVPSDLVLRGLMWLGVAG